MPDPEPRENPSRIPLPATLSPRLWETAQTLDLPEELLHDIREYDELTGDILLDAADHLESAGRPDRARHLLEAIRENPPDNVTAQYATYSLMLLLRAAGEEKAADDLVDELLDPDRLDPVTASTVAEEFERDGKLEEALRGFEIAAREPLTLPADQIDGLGPAAVVPLLGRARLRDRLGIPEDGHDRAALVMADNFISVSHPPVVQRVIDNLRKSGPAAEVRSRALHEGSGLLDDEPPFGDPFTAQAPEVPGFTVAYSRASLPRARELGMIGPHMAEADHYAETERGLRGASRRYPDTLFAVVTADADEVAAFAAEQGLDPAEESTREKWAAALPNDSPSRLPWPPERNKPCWCASGRKYKKCCGSPSQR
ncbi:SEC-C metal-binding domain-containing protein [Nocardiopsis oceani]